MVGRLGFIRLSSGHIFYSINCNSNYAICTIFCSGESKNTVSTRFANQILVRRLNMQINLILVYAETE